MHLGTSTIAKCIPKIYVCTPWSWWGNCFWPMGELLWADGGTAFGRWVNCFRLLGELLVSDGGTAFGQWGNRIQALCYNSSKLH